MSDRNLNPHAEARVAMAIWSHEYAYEQKGGSMDFWDSRTAGQKETCIKFVNEIRGLSRADGTPAPHPISVGDRRVGARLLNGYLNAVAMLGYGDKSAVIELIADARMAFGPDAAPAAECQAPAEQLVAEVLTVDMGAPLTAVDRLRALAGGSRDIAFEPSDADEILEKLEALAAILSAPNLGIGDDPAPAERLRVTDEMVEAARFTLVGICGFEVTAHTVRKTLEVALAKLEDQP